MECRNEEVLKCVVCGYECNKADVHYEDFVGTQVGPIIPNKVPKCPGCGLNVGMIPEAFTDKQQSE